MTGGAPMAEQDWTAVVAGTPVDTRMGLACLERAGLRGRMFPVSRDPRDQTRFQLSPAGEKRQTLLNLLLRAKGQGCRRVYVYCNSMSAAVDFSALAEETDLQIVTPMDVYRRLAPRYDCLGVLAANAQGLAGIERALLSAAPALDLRSAANLSLVLGIEGGEPPEALVERFCLPALAAWFAACGAQALILGCTHFPYIREALAARTSLPLLDPAEEMIELLEA